MHMHTYFRDSGRCVSIIYFLNCVMISCNRFQTLHIVSDILMISHVVVSFSPSPTPPDHVCHNPRNSKVQQNTDLDDLDALTGGGWCSKILWWLAVLINPSHVFHHLGRPRGDARMCFTRPRETGSGSSLSSWQSWCGDGSSQAAIVIFISPYLLYVTISNGETRSGKLFENKSQDLLRFHDATVKLC